MGDNGDDYNELAIFYKSHALRGFYKKFGFGLSEKRCETNVNGVDLGLVYFL